MEDADDLRAFAFSFAYAGCFKQTRHSLQRTNQKYCINRHYLACRPVVRRRKLASSASLVAGFAAVTVTAAIRRGASRSKLRKLQQLQQGVTDNASTTGTINNLFEIRNLRASNLPVFWAAPNDVYCVLSVLHSNCGGVAAGPAGGDGNGVTANSRSNRDGDRVTTENNYSSSSSSSSSSLSSSSSSTIHWVYRTATRFAAGSTASWATTADSHHNPAYSHNHHPSNSRSSAVGGDAESDTSPVVAPFSYRDYGSDINNNTVASSASSNHNNTNTSTNTSTSNIYTNTNANTLTSANANINTRSLGVTLHLRFYHENVTTADTLIASGSVEIADRGQLALMLLCFFCYCICWLFCCWMFCCWCFYTLTFTNTHLHFVVVVGSASSHS